MVLFWNFVEIVELMALSWISVEIVELIEIIEIEIITFSIFFRKILPLLHVTGPSHGP